MNWPAVLWTCAALLGALCALSEARAAWRTLRDPWLLAHDGALVAAARSNARNEGLRVGMLLLFAAAGLAALLGWAAWLVVACLLLAEGLIVLGVLLDRRERVRAERAVRARMGDVVHLDGDGGEG